MEKRIIPGRLELETFSHATEDFDLVKRAFLSIVPLGLEKSVREEVLYGHYKNRILKLCLETEKRAEVMAFLKKIPKGFLPEITSESRASFRLSKAGLLLGEWRSALPEEPFVLAIVSFRVFPKGESLDSSYFSDLGREA